MDELSVPLTIELHPPGLWSMFVGQKCRLSDFLKSQQLNLPEKQGPPLEVTEMLRKAKS